jgi:hypothetical protein
LNEVLSAEAQDAYDDFRDRTLSRMPSSLARLIYVASTRDYNSGAYHHEGLSARFGATAAAKALVHCHRKTFQAVSLLPLQRLTEELQKYMDAARERPRTFLDTWQRLEPYRVAIPLDADPTAADLFISNIKFALAVLRRRLPKPTDHPQGALPLPSPDPQSPPLSHN